jgi:hypothetical protein
MTRRQVRQSGHATDFTSPDLMLKSCGCMVLSSSGSRRLSRLVRVRPGRFWGIETS